MRSSLFLVLAFLISATPASGSTTLVEGSVEVFSSISAEFPVGTPGSLQAVFDSSLLTGGQVFIAWGEMLSFQHDVGGFSVELPDIPSATCIDFGGQTPGCGLVFNGDSLIGAVGQIIIPVSYDPRIRLRVNGADSPADPFSTIEDLDLGVTVASAGYFGLVAAPSPPISAPALSSWVRVLLTMSLLGTGLAVRLRPTQRDREDRGPAAEAQHGPRR